MKRELLAAILLTALCSAPLFAAEPALQAQVKRADGWGAYHVAMIAEGGEPGRFSARAGGAGEARGRLGRLPRTNDCGGRRAVLLLVARGFRVDHRVRSRRSAMEF